MWWFILIITALWRLRQEDAHEVEGSLGNIMIPGKPELHSEFHANLSYNVRPCIKNPSKQINKYLYPGILLYNNILKKIGTLKSHL